MERNPLEFLHYEIRRLQFVENHSGINDSFSGLIIIKSSNWVSVTISDIKI